MARHRLPVLRRATDEVQTMSGRCCRSLYEQLEALAASQLIGRHVTVLHCGYG